MVRSFRAAVRAAALTLFAALAFGTAAHAETVEGRVAAAGQDGLDMVVYDPQGRPYPNTLRLYVDGRTQLFNMRSLDELNPEDPIGAEIRQTESGLWHADSITLFREFDAAPASPKRPSPSLSGLLGNPVARGALLGAATGAIASSSSGGKAGKGALIGAGVGAAGGLLESMFSQPARSSSDDDYR